MTFKVYIWYPEESKSSLISAINYNPVGHVSMQINHIYISHRPAKFNQSIIDHEHTLQSLREKVPIYLPIASDEFIQLYSPTDGRDNTIKYVKFEAVEREHLENDTYEKECKRRGEADKCISIDWLNEDKMLKYYSSLSPKDLKYHPLKNNCCTFVADIIKHSLDCPKLSFSSDFYCQYCQMGGGDLRESLIYLKDNYEEIFNVVKRTYQKNYSSDSNLNHSLKIINTLLNYLLSSFGLVIHQQFGAFAYFIWTPNHIELFLDRLKLQKKCLKKKPLLNIAAIFR